MAKIKVIDFLKNVELNRKSLINSLKTANIDIDASASLSNAVNKANEKILEINQQPDLDYDIPDGYFEVRYVDIDGTLLKTEIVKKGETTTPPQNPSYDSERLQFVR